MKQFIIIFKSHNSMFYICYPNKNKYLTQVNMDIPQETQSINNITLLFHIHPPNIYNKTIHSPPHTMFTPISNNY